MWGTVLRARDTAVSDPNRDAPAPLLGTTQTAGCTTAGALIDTLLIKDSSSVSGDQPKRPRSRHSNQYVYTMSTAAKEWELPKCPSKMINKMWSTHTMQYYSALERKEILTQATMWLSLEDIIVREINRMPKDKSCYDST